MSKYKVHGRIGNSLKSVEMERGDFSVERLKSKFSQVLGYGVALQYISSQGQGSVATDKQLEEAIADNIKKRKYNLELILIKDGSNPKSVSSYVPQPRTNNISSSSSNNDKPTYSSSTPKQTTTSSTPSYNNTTSKPQVNSFSSSKQVSSNSSGSLDEDLKREINVARTNPHVYIKILEERSKSYEGNVLFVSKGDVKYKTKTNEGKEAVLEAINTLKSMQRLDAYDYPITLSQCAFEVATKIGTNPVDKNKFSSIIESHGQYNGELKLLRGHFYEHDDAQDLVVHFLVSDGDKNRTSRNILLSSNLKIGGIGVVDGDFPRLCTLQFTSEWK